MCIRQLLVPRLRLMRRELRMWGSGSGSGSDHRRGIVGTLRFQDVHLLDIPLPVMSVGPPSVRRYLRSLWINEVEVVVERLGCKRGHTVRPSSFFNVGSAPRSIIHLAISMLSTTYNGESPSASLRFISPPIVIKYSRSSRWAYDAAACIGV